MPTTSPWVWAAFNLFILALLALDLGVFHRRSHTVSIREASLWSAVWIALALLFNLGIYRFLGSEPALQFLTGYLIEKSLSVDNLFVFALLFGYFAVPSAYQHRVLFWGILGALVMRAGFIFAGSALLDRFHFLIYVFGAFLVFTGIKMALQREMELHPEKNPLVKLVRRFFPVTERYEEDKLFVRTHRGWAATPLFLVLVLVESTDLVFAVDSIPAIFAVTKDPFLVYTSNVFAILGLRSLYFVLAGVMNRFVYLKLGLGAVLVFVGAKMLASEVYKVPGLVSLGVILSLVTASIVASLIKTRRDAAVLAESRVDVPEEAR